LLSATFRLASARGDPVEVSAESNSDTSAAPSSSHGRPRTVARTEEEEWEGVLVSEHKPELTAAILERRRQGATIPTIMDEFDLSHTGVWYHLQKCFAAGSLAPKSKYHVVPPERLREVQRLRKLGCTIPRIAKELGITYCQTLNAVRKLIRAKKVPAKRYLGRVEMIREMRAADLSRGEIAEALGLTRDMVGSYIHNLINRGLVERKPYKNAQ